MKENRPIGEIHIHREILFRDKTRNLEYSQNIKLSHQRTKHDQKWLLQCEELKDTLHVVLFISIDNK